MRANAAGPGLSKKKNSIKVMLETFQYWSLICFSLWIPLVDWSVSWSVGVISSCYIINRKGSYTSNAPIGGLSSFWNTDIGPESFLAPLALKAGVGGTTRGSERRWRCSANWMWLLRIWGRPEAYTISIFQTGKQCGPLIFAAPFFRTPAMPLWT